MEERRGPTAILVLNAWLEDDPRAPLRVRIKSVVGDDPSLRRQVVLVDDDEVCAAIRAWLADLRSLSGGRQPTV
ncbi:MAG: hypothetical protein KY462_13980 [Actinobacteria bacterium]|nr:hypothetical protein [Actinomycetota bacterium]